MKFTALAAAAFLAFAPVEAMAGARRVRLLHHAARGAGRPAMARLPDRGLRPRGRRGLPALLHHEPLRPAPGARLPARHAMTPPRRRRNFAVPNAAHPARMK